jgi:hypothetical protein
VPPSLQPGVAPSRPPSRPTTTASASSYAGSERHESPPQKERPTRAKEDERLRAEQQQKERERAEAARREERERAEAARREERERANAARREEREAANARPVSRISRNSKAIESIGALLNPPSAPNQSESSFAEASSPTSNGFFRAPSPSPSIRSIEVDEATTLANVEEMLEGFEWRGGGSQQIETRLAGELEALEQASVHAIIESDEQVSLVVKHLDQALAELDRMDQLISLYKTQLNVSMVFCFLLGRHDFDLIYSSTGRGRRHQPHRVSG